MISPSDAKREGASALLILEALENQAHIVLIEREGALASRSLWVSYRKLLLTALEIDGTARQALKMLLRHEEDPASVADYLVRSAAAHTVSVADSYKLVLGQWGEKFVNSVFSAFGKIIREREIPGLLEGVGIQLYEYSPVLLESSGLDLTDLERFEIQSRSNNLRDWLEEDPGRLVYMPGVVN
jgi:hypothetical protein